MGKQSSVETLNSIDRVVLDVQNDVNKENEIEMQRAKKAELDRRVLELRDQMFEFADQYGIEDFRTQLMIRFHEVAMTMQDCVHLIQGVTISMSYMFETIGFIDEMMDYQKGLMTESITHPYGPIARIREWFRIRKTVRNIRNRMKMVSARIAAIQGISHVIVEELSKATLKMQKKIHKNDARYQKRNPTADTGESKSMQMVRDYLASRGAVAPSPDSSSSGGIAPTKSADPDDDFSDIV